MSVETTYKKEMSEMTSVLNAIDNHFSVDPSSLTMEMQELSSVKKTKVEK